MALHSIPAGFALFNSSANAPVLLVLAISTVVGLLMVIVFRYTSNQKAIGRAKDQLKAHLLAVRLFQDQLPVVMRAYGTILRGTGSYLRLAFTPFLIAILPITFLMVQLDRYFGWMPLQPAQTFLVEARVDDPVALNDASLQLPPSCLVLRRRSMFPKIRKLCGEWWRGAPDNSTSRSLRPVRPLRNRWSWRRGWPVFHRYACGKFLGAHVYLERSRRWPENSPVQSIAITLSSASARLRGDGMELDCVVFCGFADCRVYFQESAGYSGMKFLSLRRTKSGLVPALLWSSEWFCFFPPRRGLRRAGRGICRFVLFLDNLCRLSLFLLRAGDLADSPACCECCRRRKAYGKAQVKRVVIVGFDGMDPELAKRFMSEGKLPNLARLRDGGTFLPLRTTFPAISPVAWSTFQTGVNPGKHNIYDFLARDLKNYLPFLSSAQISEPKRHLRIGKYSLPLGKSEVKGLRKGTPFWHWLGKAGVFCSVIRVPVTFPPEKFPGVLLSGMCVPDLKGSQGTFCFCTTRASSDKFREGGVRIPIERNGARISFLRSRAGESSGYGQRVACRIQASSGHETRPGAD